MIKKKINWTFEKKLYIVGLFLIPMCIIVTLMFHNVFQWLENIGFECTIYMLTGYYCPGCGGTRSINYLLHGDIISSFIYHPFVLVALIMYVYFMASHTISFFIPNYEGMELKQWHSNLLLVIVVINFLVKNILLHYGIVLLH